MAYESATNPNTGEKLFLVDNKWVPPSETATNPKTGQRAFLVNNEWQVLDIPKAAPTAAPATATEVAPIISPEEQAGAVAPTPGLVAPTVAAQPKPPSELAMGSEFGKGTKSGVIGVKSTVAGVNLLKDANLIGSAIKNLDVYKQIDEGKIASLADAEGLGLPKDQVRMYLAAKSPEAREQMKQNQQGIIDKRQGFIKEGLNLFKQYQAEAERVKGVTPDATDIGTAKDFGNWLAFNVGSGAVQLAPIILAAVTTGTPGALAIGTAMGLGETVGNRLDFIQNKVKDLPPEQQANEIEKYIRNTTDVTMAVGLASGALDLAGPVGSILRARAGKEGVKYLTKKEALVGGAKQLPRDIVEEGLTGAGQEITQIAGQRYLKEQEGEAFSKENVKRVINAAAAEAAGGPAGTTINTVARVAQVQAEQNREKAKEIFAERDKILQTLNQPGALERLGGQFNDIVEDLKTSINPKTVKKDGSGGRVYTEEEAYEVAGNLILQGGLLDGTESTIGGTDQSSVSVSGKPSETNTGAVDTTGGNLAAAGTTTTDVGSGEGTELNTLAAELKAKYNLTDEQALKNAEESLRQKQIAAQQQAAGAGTPTPPAITVPQNLVDLYAKSIAAEEANSISSSPANKRNATMASRRLIEAKAAQLGFTKADYLKEIDSEAIRALDDAIIDAYDKQQTDQTTEVTSSAPPVKTGKPRGRPAAAKTPEEQAKADAYKKQRQDIGRNAINDVTKAEKVLAQEVDEAAIFERSANDKEAQDALFALREQRIGALETAYRLSVDPDQKKKTAGTRATALLQKADPQEIQLAKQRYEAKQKIGAPSRSAMTAQDLKDKQQLEATKRRLALQKPISIFTEAFKKWFGNSKIVNKDGTPKRMYHGTARDISEFKGKQANAIFLTDDPVFAEGFTSMSEDYMVKNIMEEQGLTPKKIEELQNKAKKIADRDGTSFNDVYYNLLREQLPSRANIIPVYVKAENPFDYENPYHIEAVINALTPKERDTALADVSFSPDRLVSTIARGSWVTIESAPIQAAIRRAGFDAFQVWEGNRKNLAVYNSNQVKSVFNQAPTEDANISRAQRLESTNGQDNTAFEKFDYAKGAVNFIAQNGNPFERVLAKRLLPFLNGVKFVVVDSPDDMPTTFLRDKMAGAAGLYVPDRKTIYVMRDGGINNTVVLHEALHAATVDRIDTYLRLSELKEGYTPIPPSLSVPVLELMYTMDAAKQNYDRLKAEALESGNLGVLTQDMLDIPEEAFTDIKEFVAYGMSLPAMQEFLIITPGNKEITYAGEPPGFIDRLFTRFVQNIRQLFDMDEKHTSALQDLIIVTDKLLSAPLPEMAVESGEPVAAKAKQPAPPKVPKPPKQLKMVESLLRKVGRSKTSTELNASIGELILQTRNLSDALKLLKAAYNALDVGKLRKVLPTLTTSDITRWAGDSISNLKVINDAVQDMAGMRTLMIRKLAEDVEGWTKYNNKYKKGGEILADLINASTLLQVDPAKYPDMATALQNDPELKRIEKDILNPPVDPKTNKPKSIPSLKKERTERTAAIKLVYEGGTHSNSITGEKYTLGGWEQLGKIGKGEGQALYVMARDSYKKTFNLHEQILKEKIAASNVPGDINDASTPKGKLIAAITKTFQEARILDIYFPLMRYGNFWYSLGKGKSGEFYMFESSTARNNAIDTRVAELNRAGDKRTRDQLIADGDIDVGDDIRKLREKHVESSDMLKQIFDMLDSNKTADVDTLKDSVYQMWLMTLPDKDIRRKFVHRQGKTGFSTDALRNFIVSQHTAANQLARLKYADKIRNGIAAAYAEISQNPDKLKLAAFIREISLRALSEITPSAPNEDGINWDELATVGNKVVFYWLLTAPKSALVQMTQLAVVGLPTLGATYGMANTLKTAARYGALWNKFGVPVKDPNGNILVRYGQPSINDSNYVNKHKDPAYRKVLKDAWNFANDKDIFMSTYTGDMTSMSEVPSTRYQDYLSRGTRFTLNFIGGAFHHAERISREIMFMSSFELAYADYKKKGMDDKAAFDAATKRAFDLTNEALFNYTQYDKPRVMKNPAGRIAFQFLTYPLQMTMFLTRNFLTMVRVLPTLEERREAAIKFFGTLFMTFNLAGITGFPMYSLLWGAVEAVREAMRPGMGEEDEEPYDPYYDQYVFGFDTGNPLGARDLDMWFRTWFIPRYFGPESGLAEFLGLSADNARLLVRAIEQGPLSALTDWNLNPSTSLNGMWFRDDTPAKDQYAAYQDMILGLGGPLVSLGGNFAMGMRDWNNGQTDRAIEKVVPAFIKGSFTAARYAAQGAKTTKGDVIRNQEFFTTGKLFGQILGFGSTELAQIQKHNFMAKQQASIIESEKKKLLDRLDLAVDNEQKDDKKYEENINKVLADILKYNKKNGVIDAIEDETIDKSLEARAKRREESYQGLSVPERYQEFIYPLVEKAR